MSDTERLKSALGLAMKAGKVRSGELSADKALKSGRAFVAVVDEEASDNTKERWSAAAENAEIPLISCKSMGIAIGKPSHMVACITDRGFAEMILKARHENEL